MKNKFYIVDQFGAGGLYSGPGNFFVNMLQANQDYINETEFHLVHGNPNQKSIDVFMGTHYVSESGGKYNDLAYGLNIKKYIKNNNIDLIQTTHAYMGSISAAKEGIRKGIPTFLRIAKSSSELKNRSFFSKILNLSKRKVDVIKSADSVVAISREIENELLKLGINSQKIKYIPNGVNITRFNRDNVNETIISPFNNGQVVIGFCGALIKRKQPHLLLKALKLLPEHFTACFIGPYINDSYTQDMMKYIKENNLSKRVYFTGFIENPEDYLKCVDFFCLLSLNEGMPNALLEAMSCKCIPICTEISGIQDVINSQEVGFLIRPDVAQLVDTLKQLENCKEKYATLIREHIVKNFSATSTFQKYMAMYKEKLK